MPEQDHTPRASKNHWHIEHSRDAHGIETLCGRFIPWRTHTGQVAATHGERATTGRGKCPSCDALQALVQDVDQFPLSVPSLLDEADMILRGGAANV